MITPMEWKDITLKTYGEIYEITSNAFTSEEDKRFKVAALLNGITFDELLEQPIGKTTEMMASTAFMYERPKPEKIKKEYTLNGRKYTPFKDFTEMSTAQYIDYQAVIVERFEEHLIDIMYILLTPKGHLYNDGYDADEVKADLETLSVTEALGLADFFLKRYRRLLRRTLLYLRVELEMAYLKAPKNLRTELREKMKEMNRKIDELHTMYGSLSLKRLLV